jgi:hypothetical protein
MIQKQYKIPVQSKICGFRNLERHNIILNSHESTCNGNCPLQVQDLCHIIAKTRLPNLIM